MADQEVMEPLDDAKKLHINEVLVPELDDAIVKIANMRKKQPAMCKSRALRIASNTVKYYSQFTVECEEGEWNASTSSMQHGLSQYGSVDFGMAQNLSSLTKAMRDCLEERNDILKVKVKKEKEMDGTSLKEDDKKISFPNLKRITFFQAVPLDEL